MIQRYNIMVVTKKQKVNLSTFYALMKPIHGYTSKCTSSNNAYCNESGTVLFRHFSAQLPLKKLPLKKLPPEINTLHGWSQPVDCPCSIARVGKIAVASPSTTRWSPCLKHFVLNFAIYLFLISLILVACTSPMTSSPIYTGDLNCKLCETYTAPGSSPSFRRRFPSPHRCLSSPRRFASTLNSSH